MKGIEEDDVIFIDKYVLLRSIDKAPVTNFHKKLYKTDDKTFS